MPKILKMLKIIINTKPKGPGWGQLHSYEANSFVPCTVWKERGEGIFAFAASDQTHSSEGWTFTNQLCGLNSASYSSGAIMISLASVIILNEGKAAKQRSLNKYEKKRKGKKNKKKGKQKALLSLPV